MADEQVTQPTPTTDAGTATSPATPSAPKPHAPSPLAFAKKPMNHPVAPKTQDYSEADVKAAEAFGRVDENGSVFVKEAGTERQVGQFPGADTQEALTLYARRYLDLKAKLELFAARLDNPSIKPHEIDESIATLGEEITNAEVVGDTAALHTRYEELKAQGLSKKEELAKARQEAVAKAIRERTAIVEEAEALAASLGDSTNWKSATDKVKALFERWQEHQKTTARIDKPTADALWARFSAARSAVNQGRRKWGKARDAAREQTKAAKEAIIKEANELKDSTEWGATSHKFNELMDRWKSAGFAGRREEDDLWARFRQAADTFFDARQADRDQMSSSEQENLAKKEELLKKAQALLPVADEKAAKQARQALSSIQDEWDQIGYVPRNDVHRIENGLDQVDSAIKAVEDAAWKKSDPEADARVSSFESQLKAQLQALDEQIAAEGDAKRKAKLEAEKATKEQWLNAVK